MKSWAKWTAKTVLVTTGFAAAGGGFTGVAFAGTGGPSTGNVSVLGGNNVDVPVSIPIDICGNAVAILGIATAGCQGGASVAAASSGSGPAGSAQGPSTGNISVAHGTVVRIPVVVAADACGNSVGNATAHCRGGVRLPASGSGWQATGGGSPKQAGLSAGNLSVGSGNDVQVPVAAPIDACGNAVAVLGDSGAGCAGGATAGDPANHSRGVKGGALRPVSRLASSHPTTTQLAGLGALPGVANLPALGGLPSLPLLNGLTGGALMPASTLSALQQGGGMSSDSFAALAIGALLAGAAALKLASRRPRARKVRTGEVSA